MRTTEQKWNLCFVTLLVMTLGVWTLSACSDDDGLSAGDPNYFTSSRGQFTATIDDANGNPTTLFLIPGTMPGTATVTFDGSNPRHLQSLSTATVRVGTYQNDLVIPETVTVGDNTYTITAIGDEAFTGCRAYTSGGVTYWNGLTSVTLPETVTTLGDGAFAISDITAVNLPQSVSVLPMACYADCTKLTAISVPGTVKAIGQMAFYGCTAVTTLTLAEGIESIGEMAFFDCNKLTEVTIPASVRTIGDKAFGGRESRRSKVAVYHMMADVPPVLEGTLFEAAEGVSPIVRVPASAVSAYQAAAGWGSMTIEEEVTE